jgi:hypothetical protein
VAAVPQPVRLLDDSFLRFLPTPLREPRRAWLAILLGAAVTIAGSLLLAVLSQSLMPNLATPDFPMKGPIALFLLVVFAPLLETLIMAGFLALFLRFLSPANAILLSAAGWGVAHSVEALGWGLVIWWPFLIFSTMFVVCRQRGFWPGVGDVAATHALQNLGPALKVAYG